MNFHRISEVISGEFLGVFVEKVPGETPRNTLVEFLEKLTEDFKENFRGNRFGGFSQIISGGISQGIPGKNA